MRNVYAYCDYCGKQIKPSGLPISIEFPDGCTGKLDLCKKHKNQFIKKLKTLIEEFENGEKNT